MTVHNEANKEEIAEIVIMPGDPLRAKYIVENFFESFELVNSVRNIFAYTGIYKGKRITVMASGMGMPSMGIYCYELYKFYDVKTIIRVGSCGAYDERINLLDTILVDGSFTPGNFAKNYNNQDIHFINADKKVNGVIEQVAEEDKIKIKKENIACTECFDPYIENVDDVVNSFPANLNIIGAEMESFALFYTAKMLGKSAACLLTVVDSIKKKASLTADERQKSLKDMIKLALDTAIKL